MRILLVEDNKILASVTREYLKSAGYEVFLAADSVACLKLLNDDEFDLIVLEVVLPDRSGIDLCKEIKSKDSFQDIPIIFLSSLTNKDALVDGLNAGGKDFITKPFNKEELLARVKVNIDLKLSNDLIKKQNELLRREIESRKQAEQSLKISESVYQAVVEDQIEMICRIKPDGTIIFVNNAFCNYFEFSKQDIINNNLFDILVDDDRKIRYKNVLQLGNSETLNHEDYFYDKEGNIKWYNWNLRAIRDTSGMLKEIQGVGADITEKKKIIEELNELSLFNYSIIDNAGEGIAVLDRNFKFQTWNKAMEIMSEFRADEVIGIDCRILFPNIIEKFGKDIDIAFTGQQVKTTVYQLTLTKSQDNLWVSGNFVPHINKYGDIIGLIAVFSNHTEKVIKENQLKESQIRLATLIDSLPFDFWALDNDWNYILQNKSCIDNWKDVKGRNFHELDDYDGLKDIWYANNLKAFSGISVEEHYTLNNAGNDLHKKSVISPVIIDEEIKGIIGTEIDITEIINYQNALKESESKYRLLFDNMLDAFTINEIIYNSEGKPIDYMVTEYNKSYLKLSGFSEEQVKSLSSSERSKEHFHEFFDKIEFSYHSGKSQKFEFYSELYCKYLSLSIYFHSDNKFALIFDDISERKIAEVKLKESEEQFRQLTENIDEVIWLRNKESILYISSSSKKLFNIDSNELISNTNLFYDCIHHEYLELVKSKLYGKEYLEEGKLNIEFKVVIDNKEKWFWCRSFPIFDENSNLIKIAGIVEDITDIKASEEIIRKANLVIEKSNTVIIIWEDLLNLKPQYISESIRHYGYNAKDFIEGTLDFESIIYKEDIEKVRNTITENRLNSKTHYSIDCRHLTFNKEIKWMEIRITDKQTSGTTYYSESISIDISDRKKAEEKLYDSENRWQFAVESSGDGLWEWDVHSGEFLISNNLHSIMEMNIYENIFSINEWETKIHPDDLSEFATSIEYHFKGDYPQIYLEHRLKCSTGVYKWVLDRAKILTKDLNGDPLKVIGTITDISKRKNIEINLFDTSERLKLAKNAANMGIFDLDCKNNILIWDEELFEIFGVKSSDYKNAREAFDTLIYSDDVKMIDEATSLPNLTSNKIELEFGYRKGNNQHCIMKSISDVIFDEFGEPSRIIGVNYDITESKKSEKEIVEVRSLLEATFEQNPAPMVLVEYPSMFVRIANSAFIDFYNIDKEIIPNKMSIIELRSYWQEFLPNGVMLSPYQTPLTQSLKGNRIKNEEYYIKCKDGSVKWELVNSAPIFNSAGELIAAFAVVNDITNIKSAQEKIKQSEDKFRFITENLIDVIWQTDIDLNYTYLSPSISNYSNQSPSDMIGKSILENILPKYHQLIIEKHKESIVNIENKKQPESDTIECESYLPDETSIWSEITYTALIDSNFELIGYQGITRDITKRKLTELAVIESEKRFRTLITSSPDSIFITDLSGLIKFSSLAGSNLFGYDTKSFAEKSITNLLDKTDVNHFNYSINKLIEGKYPQPETFVAHKADGSKIFIEINFSLLKNSAELPEEIIFIIRDITERKKIEFQLTEAKNKAEEANRTKSEFIANISHEIRTPLNAIIGYADILKANIVEYEQKEYIKGIVRGSKNLLAIINDILDLSKIDSGHIEINYSPVNINYIINDIRQMFSLKSKEKNLEFIFETNPELPKIILTDEVRLRQILINLVGNAFKFTNKGFVKLQVDFVAFEGRIDLVFHIIDSGIGIPPSQQKIIFEPFRQQQGQSTRKFAGTGLGLTISDKLAKSMNGNILLVSSQGKGAKFTLELKNVKIPENYEYNRITESNIDIFDNKRIVLISSDIILSTIISDYFYTTNCAFEIFTDSEKAKLEANRNLADAIIIDFDNLSQIEIDNLAHLAKTGFLKEQCLLAISKDNKIPVNSDINFNEVFIKPVDIGLLSDSLTNYLKFININVESMDDKIEQLIDLIILKTDFKKLGQLSPNISSEWRKIKKLMDIDEINRFAESLILTSESMANTYLKIYAEVLRHQVSEFQLDTMNNTFNSFYKIVDYISNSGFHNE